MAALLSYQGVSVSVGIDRTAEGADGTAGEVKFESEVAYFTRTCGNAVLGLGVFLLCTET